MLSYVRRAKPNLRCFNKQNTLATWEPMLTCARFRLKFIFVYSESKNFLVVLSTLIALDGFDQEY